MIGKVEYITNRLLYSINVAHTTYHTKYNHAQHRCSQEYNKRRNTQTYQDISFF